MADRRAQIAAAGIGILASRGVRALTHLNVDRALGLPDGSTSYYARTRRDLIALVVDGLASRAADELAAQAPLDEPTPQSVASVVVAGLDAATRRADDHRARLVLLLECQGDPELHAALTARPQVRGLGVDVATAMLRQLGLHRPEVHARDLVALVDAMLMQRLIRAAPVDEGSIIAAYLTGLLPCGPAPSDADAAVDADRSRRGAAPPSGADGHES